MSDLPLQKPAGQSTKPDAPAKDVTKPVTPDAPAAPKINPKAINKEIALYGTSRLKRSATIGKISKAMANVQGACSNGAKDKQGYGYKYLTLDAVIDIIRPHQADNGISIVHTTDVNPDSAKPSVVNTLFISHESGEWMEMELTLPIHIMPQLSGAQMVGVAATYGRRYQLQAAFMIAGEEDNDASVKSTAATK